MTGHFLEFVEKEKGFEFYQAFRDEVDWVIGGKDDTYWFVVLSGRLSPAISLYGRRSGDPRLTADHADAALYKLLPGD